MTIKTLHTVQFDLSPEQVTARLKCHGNNASDCHETGCLNCDEECTCEEPEPGQVNYCLPIEAIAIAGPDAADAYDGPWMTDVRPGAPVRFEFDGDCWTWRLASASGSA